MGNNLIFPIKLEGSLYFISEDNNSLVRPVSKITDFKIQI